MGEGEGGIAFLEDGLGCGREIMVWWGGVLLFTFTWRWCGWRGRRIW